MAEELVEDSLETALVLALTDEAAQLPFEGVEVLAARDAKNAAARKIANGYLGLFGLSVLGWALWQVIRGWSDVDQGAIVREFLVPVWLTPIALIFIYGFAVAAAYETGFKRMRFSKKEGRLVKQRLAILLRSGGRLRTLRLLSGQGAQSVARTSGFRAAWNEATAATTGDTSTTVGPPLFTVVEEEDISFPGAVRISLRVTVERGTTKAQLSALAADLAARYRETHEYQAFNVFFYHHRELAFGLATLGIWNDSPFGDWSRADEVERGDYSQQKSNDATREKDWSSVPSAGQVAVYLAYTVTYDVMDVGDELSSDDDVLAAVAAQRSVSVAEVEDAVNAVLDWMSRRTG